MPIENILLHLANDDRRRERLEAGIAIAARFGAHLDILYVATPVSMPAGITGRGASYAYLAEATAIAHEKADEIHARVEERCQGIDYSWEVVEGDHVNLLARRSVYADLAIVTQSHPVFLEDRVRLHLPDRLPLQSACPTLVLPWKPGSEAILTDLLVAWKSTRESALAVRGSLPILAAAKRVTVLTIDAPEAPSDEGRKLVRYLERHGVQASLRQNLSEVSGDDVGEIILGVARDIGADGLVMGCYGHSRLRELVAGGATRHVLGHMDLPVIMAH